MGEDGRSRSTAKLLMMMLAATDVLSTYDSSRSTIRSLRFRSLKAGRLRIRLTTEEKISLGINLYLMLYYERSGDVFGVDVCSIRLLTDHANQTD